MSDLPPAQRRLPDYLLLTLKGFCMGVADAIPGISGGTIALLLGIYRELVQSIRDTADFSHLQRLLRGRFAELLRVVPWRFLSAVAAGILLGVLSLAHLMEAALEQHPLTIWSFFFGLVAASAIVVSRRVSRWNPIRLAGLALGTAGMYLLAGLVPAETPEALWMYFLSGAVAICAMILPGISGAFILVLLGKYQAMLSAVTQRDLLTLAVFILGCVAGLVTIVRLLSWLFRKYPDGTLVVLIGLMLGSLRRLWPWKAGPALEFNVLPPASPETLTASLIALIGFFLVLGLEALARRLKAPAA
jgi:putative membrane protein